MAHAFPCMHTHRFIHVIYSHIKMHYSHTKRVGQRRRKEEVEKEEEEKEKED